MDKIIESLVARGFTNEQIQALVNSGLFDGFISPELTSIFSGADGRRYIGIRTGTNATKGLLTNRFFSFDPTSNKWALSGFAPVTQEAKNKNLPFFYSPESVSTAIDAAQLQKSLNTIAGNDSTYYAQSDGSIFHSQSDGPAINTLDEIDRPQNSISTQSNSQAYGGRLYSRGGRIQTRPAPKAIRAQNGLKLHKAEGMGNDEYDVYL